MVWTTLPTIALLVATSVGGPVSSTSDLNVTQNATFDNMTQLSNTSLSTTPWPQTPFQESIGIAQGQIEFEEVTPVPDTPASLNTLQQIFQMLLVQTRELFLPSTSGLVVVFPNADLAIPGFSFSFNIRGLGRAFLIRRVLEPVLHTLSSVFRQRSFARIKAVLRTSPIIEECNMIVSGPIIPDWRGYRHLFIAYPHKPGLYIKMSTSSLFPFAIDMAAMARLRFNFLDGLEMQPDDDPFFEVHLDAFGQHNDHYSLDMRQADEVCPGELSFSNKLGREIFNFVFEFASRHQINVEFDIFQMNGEDALTCGSVVLKQTPPLDNFGASEGGNGTIIANATVPAITPTNVVAVARS